MMMGNDGSDAANAPLDDVVSHSIDDEDAANAPLEDVVSHSIDSEAVSSKEGTATSNTADQESRVVTTSDVDIGDAKSTHYSPIDGGDEYTSLLHGEEEETLTSSRDMARSATALDDEESAEKLIILPNAGDPIILPVKSKPKSKQKIFEPTQDDDVVGDVLDEKLVQLDEVSDKQGAKIDYNEEVVEKAALVEELSHDGESSTISLSESSSFKSGDVDDVSQQQSLSPETASGDISRSTSNLSYLQNAGAQSVDACSRSNSSKDKSDINSLDAREISPIDANSTESKINGEGEDGPRKIKLVDYASKLAGAQILEQSPSLKGSSNLLTGDKDKYSIAPCMDKKYVVIGLSEDILVKQIILSNYERYSSRVKKFQVLASQEYPTPSEDYWNSIGTYDAHSKSGEQSFDLLEPTWARYLKFRFLSHYGSEHYCTLSQIKVHGSTMLQGFHEQWIESEKKDWESGQEDGIVEEGGENSEAKSVGEEGDAKKESMGEENEEVENVMGEGEIVTLDEASIDEMSNGREVVATEKTPTATINDEKQNMSRATVAGERQQETTVYSIQGIDGEESSVIREAPESDEPPPEIILGTKHSGDSAAAGYLGVGGEEVRIEIAESNANAVILDEDFTSTSDSIEHQEIASDVDIAENNAGDLIRHNFSINALIDEVKSVTDASDAIEIDSSRTTVSSVATSNSDEKISNTTSSVGSGDRDEKEELSRQHLSATKMEETALAETPMKQVDNISLSQATDESSKDNFKPKGYTASADTAKEDTRPEIVISVSKEDSKAAAGRGPIEHEVMSQTGKAGKESRGMDKSTGELYAKLFRRFPHALCMKDLDFQAFKSKTLPVHAGSGGSVGGKMEPIFTKITSEIKSVQIIQHQYEQYISALKACYEAMFLDMAKDLDSMQTSFDQRLSSLERADVVSVMRTKVHLNPSSIDRLSAVSSTYMAMVHQVASAPTIQEHSNVLCAASLTICFLLLWRTVRNGVRGSRQKRDGDTEDKDNRKSTSVHVASNLSYNSNPQKNDRKCITKHIHQIPELIAEENLSPELISDNNLLKKELIEVKCKLADTDEKLRCLEIHHASLQHKWRHLLNALSEE
jgi:hypothetical protein